MSHNVFIQNKNSNQNITNKHLVNNSSVGNVPNVNLETQTTKDEKIQINFVKNSTISKHLICTICQEVLDDPKRIDCGHTFCHICIMQWANKNLMCPMCRQKFTKEGMSRDLIALNIINDLEVTCSNKGTRLNLNLNRMSLEK